MEYGYSLEVASPPAGRVLEELKAFLTGAGLGFASGIEHTALVRDGGGRQEIGGHHGKKKGN